MGKQREIHWALGENGLRAGSIKNHVCFYDAAKPASRICVRMRDSRSFDANHRIFTVRKWGGIKRRKKTVSCEASLHFEPKTSRDWRFRDNLSPERAPPEHQKNQFYVSNSERGLVHHEKTTRKHDTFKTGLVWSTRRMRHQWEIHDRLADSYTFWSFESQKLQVLNWFQGSDLSRLHVILRFLRNSRFT